MNTGVAGGEIFCGVAERMGGFGAKLVKWGGFRGWDGWEEWEFWEG